MAVDITLGAPGVYQERVAPLRAFTGVRMDIAGFAGVAPRGPARVPLVDERHPPGVAMLDPARPRSRSVAVPVHGWDEYRRLFGGFEGPGRLPWAVASFFAQGGRRAWVVRVVHGAQDAPGDVAAGALSGVTAGEAGVPVLRARSVGSWGRRLQATLRFATTLLHGELEPGFKTLVLTAEADIPAASLLRLTLPDGTFELRWVRETIVRPRAHAPGADRVAILEDVASAQPVAIEIVLGELAVDDGDGRRERIARLGLRDGHPRWCADALCDESTLVWPDRAWATGELLPSVQLHDASTALPWQGGEDRYGEIEPQDMFDAGWTPGDEPDTRTTAGIHALLEVEELAMLCVPDLYEPEPFEPAQPVPITVAPAGPEFDRCLERDDAAQAQPVAAPLSGLTLDPRDPADLEQIVACQREVVALAEHAGWSALLDVPPGLTRRAVLRWRSRFDSSCAAAYHPWLRVHGLGPAGDGPRRVPPSAVAAGIVAAQELAHGIPHGPAGVVAARVVAVEQALASTEHDELHLAAINVFALERDGVRLTAARTLASDPRWRQLSVRRLVTMIVRALRQQLAWAVFEPADEALRGRLRCLLASFMRELHARGALAGGTPEEGYFVRCDATNNPRASVDAGRLIVEIGVAPVEPLEYIVLRLERGADGTVRLEGLDA